jgi:hypothetical protein
LITTGFGIVEINGDIDTGSSDGVIGMKFSVD